MSEVNPGEAVEAMTFDQFMHHAADAAYMGDESLLRGYAKQLFDEVDRLRNEVDAARVIYEMASESWEEREREAETRGARWALDIALDPSKWPVSKWTPEEVCRDARERGDG